MLCPNCGARSEPGAAFCADCGTLLPRFTAETLPAIPLVAEEAATRQRSPLLVVVGGVAALAILCCCCVVVLVGGGLALGALPLPATDSTPTRPSAAPTISPLPTSPRPTEARPPTEAPLPTEARPPTGIPLPTEILLPTEVPPLPTEVPLPTRVPTPTPKPTAPVAAVYRATVEVRAYAGGQPFIRGRVTDRNGRAVSGVIVELYNGDKGYLIGTGTGADGRYELTVSAGAYYIKLQNRKSDWSPLVTVKWGQEATVDWKER